LPNSKKDNHGRGPYVINTYGIIWNTNASATSKAIDKKAKHTSRRRPVHNLFVYTKGFVKGDVHERSSMLIDFT
jgi:hypothetical protein